MGPLSEASGFFSDLLDKDRKMGYILIMPMTINPVRKALLKKEMLKGKSQRQALKDAGYYPDGNASKDNKLLNTIKAEIQEDIKKLITVDTVLAGLCKIQDLATANKDYSTATRCEELKGKWLSMFTDRQEIVPVEKEENSFSVSRLSKLSLPTVALPVTAPPATN